MNKCNHCWYKPSEKLKICIFCRYVQTIEPMREYTEEEYNKLYTPIFIPIIANGKTRNKSSDNSE